MSHRSVPHCLVAAAGLSLFVFFFAVADLANAAGGPPGGPPGGPGQARPKHPPFAEILGDAEGIDGLIKLYRKDMRLFAELTPGDLNRDVLVAIAIARGIGQMPLVGGMTWGFGDDWIWQFRKVDDRIQIVRRNVRFRAAGGSPLEKAVHLAYTDSILFSLPIITTGPSGGFVVDLTPVFMSDLPQFSQVLRGFGMDPNRSTWAKVKGFKNNVEIEVAATYASGGHGSVDTVPDTRGITLYIHYSLSHLPQTGYQPRLADDRVGHFLTVIKDFSKSGREDQFVRYVNRWDLRKAEPSAAVSPPVAPIIFWIEKTVPYKFRGAVRDGILDWNKALEKAGFSNAIEVRQQPDDATWDPEDISYNTFRWITSNAGLAMGPSRVNPLTGQILDADIIFDADFVEHWTKAFEIEKPGLKGAAEGAGEDVEDMQETLLGARRRHAAICNCAHEMAQQLGFGAMAMVAHGHAKILPKDQIEKLLVEGVKSVVTHELGHTLGLRHNFKASALMTMDELSDPEKTRDVGLAASVMDYVPLNLAPKGKRQGDYFSRTIGPYDVWAIEYAYKPLPGGTEGEVPGLAKIASRGTEPALQYATDEDAADSDPDPLVNRHDLSKDPIEFARWRVELINQLLPGLVERMVEPGEGYQGARQAYSVLLREHDRAMHYVARFIGGVYVNRNHKGDPNAQPPFVVTEAKKQREALEFLEQQVFGPEAYKVPAKLYDYLAPPYWNHWGMRGTPRTDFPVHEIVLSMQEHVLGQVLSPSTLSRLVDSEMRVPPKQDVFTAADLLQGLTGSIFRELEKLQEGKFTNREPAISSLRRNLQQHYFQRLAHLAMGNLPAPADCQTVAYTELQTLEARIKKVLAGKAELDAYTRSHLTELATRIHKVIEARIDLNRP
jgi:hypothetical protein